MHRGYTTPLVIAIMAFAIVAFLFLIDTAIMPANSNQVTNRTTNTNTNVSIDTSPTVDIPTDDWKTFSDTSTGVSIHYPQDWQEKSCGDAMIIYFAPEEISCGAGLNAIGLQRTTSDQTVSAAIANRQTQVEQTTVLQLTVADRDAQRLIGSDPQSALGGSETQQNDEIFFRQDEFLWSLSSTLEDDGRIFLAMADTLTLSKPATTDPAAGWKTYSAPTAKYSFQYPNGLGNAEIQGMMYVGGLDDQKAKEWEANLAVIDSDKETQVVYIYAPLQSDEPGTTLPNMIPGSWKNPTLYTKSSQVINGTSFDKYVAIGTPDNYVREGYAVTKAGRHYILSLMDAKIDLARTIVSTFTISD